MLEWLRIDVALTSNRTVVSICRSAERVTRDMAAKRDLPFGSEFSPSQIELKRVLELAELHEGNWRAFEDAVYSEYFSKHQTSEVSSQTRGVAGRPLILVDYGHVGPR